MVFLNFLPSGRRSSSVTLRDVPALIFRRPVELSCSVFVTFPRGRTVSVAVASRCLPISRLSRAVPGPAVLPKRSLTLTLPFRLALSLPSWSVVGTNGWGVGVGVGVADGVGVGVGVGGPAVVKLRIAPGRLCVPRTAATR